MPIVMGIYELPAQAAGVVTKLRGRGFADIETYAPAPFPEVEDAIDPKPSKVRLLTLIGGLTGVVTGYAMPVWMSNDWQILVGGKPYASIPPYTIIAFELTILFGGLMTFIGLLVVGKLPHGKLDPGYSARFSGEEFGLVVRCQERDVAEIDGLLRTGAARAHDESAAAG